MLSLIHDSKILTSEEVIAFFKYYNSALNSRLEFSGSVRSGFHDDNIHRCARFQHVSENGWGYEWGSADGIYFTVDKDIMLHGLCLFGSEKNGYSVTLTIKQTGTKSKLVLASKQEHFLPSCCNTRTETTTDLKFRLILQLNARGTQSTKSKLLYLGLRLGLEMTASALRFVLV